MVFMPKYLDIKEFGTIQHLYNNYVDFVIFFFVNCFCLLTILIIYVAFQLIMLYEKIRF